MLEAVREYIENASEHIPYSYTVERVEHAQ